MGKYVKSNFQLTEAIKIIISHSAVESYKGNFRLIVNN